MAAGCQKFVMLSMANGTTEVMAQTRLFIDKILPEFNWFQPCYSCSNTS